MSNLDYTQIRKEATDFRRQMFQESLKDLRFGAKDPYIWGLRDYFSQNFDFTGGAMQYFQGYQRLEGEDYQTYKDRLWVQKQLMKHRN